METITVNVNDKTISVATHSTITDLIRQMNIPPLGIAIAVPSTPLGDRASDGQETAREVIPQKQWPDYILTDRQDILIIQATQGG